MICNVCFRQCHLSEGQMGFCHARVCREGKVIPAWYGEVSALALDPVEKASQAFPSGQSDPVRGQSRV